MDNDKNIWWESLCGFNYTYDAFWVRNASKIISKVKCNF